MRAALSPDPFADSRSCSTDQTSPRDAGIGITEDVMPELILKCGRCAKVTRAPEDAPRRCPYCGGALETIGAVRGEAVDDPRAGETFGSYRILAKLGEGGMGAVYLAEHVGLRQLRALKILPKEKAAESRAAVERFLREARAAAALKHPNVVAVHHVDQVDGEYFIDMEYVDGESLQSRLKREGRLDVKEATRILSAAAEALAAAHERGIIHRDVKPANILLTRDGRVKVADFGVAKNLNEPDPGLTAPGRGGLGTPLFMSPEQWDGLRVGPASDIYSLGVTFYVMLTGEPPFQPHGRGTLAFQHRTQPPPDPRALAPDLPDLACAILARAMAKKPAARYPNCGALLRDLRALADPRRGREGRSGRVDWEEKRAREDWPDVLSNQELLDALRRFVEVEYETQRAQVEQMWTRPLSERIAEGEAIGDVEVVRADFATARLRCADNQSKFRVGDMVWLSRDCPAGQPRYACVIDEEDGDELTVSAGFKENFADLAPGPGWALDRSAPDMRNLLLGALDAAARAGDVLPVLRGERPTRIDPARRKEAERLARRVRPALDASQEEAFVRAYAASPCFLIQGPPGSGKTRVLALLAAALAARGERVLISAFTHRAINNALRMIKQAAGFERVCKVGDLRRADDLRWEGGEVACCARPPEALYSAGSEGFVVGATCFTAIGKRFDGLHFDALLCDEASQMTLPVAIAGMLKADRYVFVGDHMQMPPVVAGEHDCAWAARSVFETLFRRDPGVMLSTTYRMNAEINAFPSRHFYRGRLTPSPDAAGRRLRLRSRPTRFARALDPERPCVFLKVHHEDAKMRSEEEARVVADLVAEALRCGVSAAEIAVIAPYRAQGRLIRRRLHDAGAAARGVLVDTVERIQGQERDLLILSLTTSDPRHAAQRADFFFQPNRLNVAVTRARVKRIVVGSPSLFLARPADERRRRWVGLLRRLCEESEIVDAAADG